MVLREKIKWWLFPGINLHARLRYKILPRFFGTAQNNLLRIVLDAGCGNGMLAYQSYLRKNRVVGISINDNEVERCHKLFHDYLGISEDKLAFKVHNLYQIEALDLEIDEIICSEVLEHIADDKRVCQSFWNILKPEGILHLCCPNAKHPDNESKELDKNESGGHVRSGYTMETYKDLLEPIGFRIGSSVGIGGPIRQFFNKRIIQSEKTFCFPFAFIIFIVSLPFLVFDPSTPSEPYSLYIRAEKKL